MSQRPRPMPRLTQTIQEDRNHVILTRVRLVDASPSLFNQSLSVLLVPLSSLTKFAALLRLVPFSMVQFSTLKRTYVTAIFALTLFHLHIPTTYMFKVSQTLVPVHVVKNSTPAILQVLLVAHVRTISILMVRPIVIISMMKEVLRPPIGPRHHHVPAGFEIPIFPKATPFLSLPANLPIPMHKPGLNMNETGVPPKPPCKQQVEPGPSPYAVTRSVKPLSGNCLPVLPVRTVMSEGLLVPLLTGIRTGNNSHPVSSSLYLLVFLSYSASRLHHVFLNCPTLLNFSIA